MTTAELLRDARALIAEPGRWTQRAPARDRSGVFCGPGDTRAVCWCADGALRRLVYARRATGDVVPSLDLWQRSVYAQARYALEQATGRFNLAAWNDQKARQHGEVLLAFDRAIELAAEEGVRP